MKHPAQTLGLFLSGPSVLLLFVAALALYALALVALGRAGSLVALGQQAADRLDRGGALPILWGLSAVVLVFAAAAVLSSIKILGLLALLVFVAGVVLEGLGLAVAALRVGRVLTDAFNLLEPDDLAVLRLGLTTLFLASVVPGVGWIGVLLAGAAGVGSTLEMMLRR